MPARDSEPMWLAGPSPYGTFIHYFLPVFTGPPAFRLIVARKADMAFCNGDTAYDAYTGMERFRAAGKIPVRALACFTPPLTTS